MKLCLRGMVRCAPKVSQYLISVRNEMTYDYININNIQFV